MTVSKWFAGTLVAALLVSSPVFAKGRTAGAVSRKVPAFTQVLQQDPAGPADLYILGETHGRQQFHKFYLEALKSVKRDMKHVNCVFTESPFETQPHIEKFFAGEIAADQVVVSGITDLFNSWERDPGPVIQDWSRLANAISPNSMLSTKLLTLSRDLGFQVYAVDQMTLPDFVNATFNEVALSKGEQAALAHVEKSGFTDQLADHPNIYYRDEIINRRNHFMSEKIAEQFKNGNCTGGIAIVGAMHATRGASGGNHVYQKHRRAMNDILRNDKGLRVRNVDLSEVDSISSAIGIREYRPGLNHAVSSRWTTSDYWRATSETDIAVLIEKSR